MSCERITMWIQLYLDGRLDMRRLTRLEHHLAGCADCRHELEQMEAICQAAAAPVAALGVSESAELTHAVMARIALVETRREQARQCVEFSPGWGDALLAALLATLATALLLALQPALRQPVAQLLGEALDNMRHVLMVRLGDSPEWLAWVVWVGGGVLLALAFAGAEVRANWRRTLLARLPH